MCFYAVGKAACCVTYFTAGGSVGHEMRFDLHLYMIFTLCLLIPKNAGFVFIYNIKILSLFLIFIITIN